MEISRPWLWRHYTILLLPLPRTLHCSAHIQQKIIIGNVCIKLKADRSLLATILKNAIIHFLCVSCFTTEECYTVLYLISFSISYMIRHLYIICAWWCFHIYICALYIVIHVLHNLRSLFHNFWSRNNR